MNKYAFLLLLVPSLANAHGGNLTFLFNHVLLYLGLIIFSVVISPPGFKLALSTGLMISYPFLFFYVFPALDGSDDAWARASYITVTVIVVMLSVLRIRFHWTRKGAEVVDTQERELT